VFIRGHLYCETICIQFIRDIRVIRGLFGTQRWGGRGGVSNQLFAFFVFIRGHLYCEAICIQFIRDIRVIRGHPYCEAICILYSIHLCYSPAIRRGKRG
jgi:hypothetical protein